MMNIQQNILDVNRTWQDGLVPNETRARIVKKVEKKKTKRQKSKYQFNNYV